MLRYMVCLTAEVVSAKLTASVFKFCSMKQLIALLLLSTSLWGQSRTMSGYGVVATFNITEVKLPL